MRPVDLCENVHPSTQMQITGAELVWLIARVSTRAKKNKNREASGGSQSRQVCDSNLSREKGWQLECLVTENAVQTQFSLREGFNCIWNLKNKHLRYYNGTEFREYLAWRARMLNLNP